MKPGKNKRAKTCPQPKILFCFFNFFWCAPFGYLYRILHFLFLNEPGLGGTGIDPGMTFYIISIYYQIRQVSNPRPYNRESSSLPTRPDFRPPKILLNCVYYSHYTDKRTPRCVALSTVLFIAVPLLDNYTFYQYPNSRTFRRS